MGATTSTRRDVSRRKHTISLARGRRGAARLASAGELLIERHTGPRVGMGDVPDIERPVRRPVYERPLGRHAGQRLAERPHADGAGQLVPVVRGHHVAVAVVGVAGGSLLVEEQRLGARREVDDPIVLAVDAVDVLLDQEPPAALVDLALVEVADLGKGSEGVGVLAVDDAAQHLVGHARPERRGMHSVVAARMDLPDVAVGPELRRHVEDRVELTRTGHRSGTGAGPG